MACLVVRFCRRRFCQKPGHELAYDLNKFANGIFDESSIYCPQCRRNTLKLVSYTCEECDCDFVYIVHGVTTAPSPEKREMAPTHTKDGSSPREPSIHESQMETRG